MKTIDYTAVGQRMQQLRREQGYTQEHFAEQLDVTASFISNIENCRTKMNLRVLVYYAHMLDVSVDYLLHTEETNTDCSSLNQEIARILQNYSPEDKEKVIKILRIIKE